MIFAFDHALKRLARTINNAIKVRNSAAAPEEKARANEVLADSFGAGRRFAMWLAAGPRPATRDEPGTPAATAGPEPHLAAGDRCTQAGAAARDENDPALP